MQAVNMAERRRHPRRPAAGDSVLYAKKFGTGIAADIENISLGGMMAAVHRPIRSSEHFMVLLFGAGPDDLVCRQAKIAWQSTGGDGRNYIGLEFLQGPTEGLSTWMQKAVQGGTE